MSPKSYPVLKGDTLFRPGELVYVNKANELEEFCGVMHKHDFIEIAYVMSDNGFHAVGDYEYAVSQGDLFIINYDIHHGFFPGSDNINPVVYNCVFMPEFLDTSLFHSIHFEDLAASFLFKSLFKGDTTPYPDLRLQGIDYTEMGDLFSKMYEEYKLARKGYSDIIRAYLIELIIKIFRYMDTDARKTNIPKTNELIIKVMDYLKQNYNTNIKLKDLAARSFLSRNYISRLFREVTGTTISSYVQSLRIEEACRLLRETDMKVIDIAAQAGFHDIKFFYKTFKKITGKTPGAYKNI